MPTFHAILAFKLYVFQSNKLIYNNIPVVDTQPRSLSDSFWYVLSDAIKSVVAYSVNMLEKEYFERYCIVYIF